MVIKVISKSSLKFNAIYPVFGKIDKPLALSFQQRSVYYWWWAYLKRNKQYLACCERGGTGRMSAIYGDFGDVRSDNFRAWWSVGNRGGYLFAEPAAAVRVAELESKAEWDAEWSKDATMVIVVPLDWSKRSIQKSFASLLAKRHTRGRGKVPMKGRETSAAKYPLARNFNVSSLKTGLMVYDAVEAAKAEALHTGLRRKTFYQIGIELKLVPSAMPTADERQKNLANADKINVMTVAVSRYYKRAAAMVANVGKGQFPVS